MAIVRTIAGAVSFSIVAALSGIVACSGTDSSVFSGTSDAGDAAPTPEFDSGTFVQDPVDDGGNVAPTCSPTSSATFTPQWMKPAPFAQKACTASQMDGFYAACLNPPIDPATCDAFTKANGACATCLQSSETDSNQGPVVWHADKKYYTMNIAGCIANAQNDLSANGCGAAYQALLECNEASCSACFAASNGSFANFVSCEQAANKSSCQTYSDTMHKLCNDIHDAASVSAQCVPPSGSTATDVYKRIAPLFCGGK